MLVYIIKKRTFFKQCSTFMLTFTKFNSIPKIIKSHCSYFRKRYTKLSTLMEKDHFKSYSK